MRLIVCDTGPILHLKEIFLCLSYFCSGAALNACCQPYREFYRSIKHFMNFGISVSNEHAGNTYPL